MSKISKLTDQILIEFEKKHGECEELAYELYEAKKLDIKEPMTTVTLPYLEEELITEDKIINEISMITKEIIQHRIEIRNLEKQLYKLEDLLEIK